MIKLTVYILCISPVLLCSKTIKVGKSGADHSTIQAGVNAAGPGDIVEVQEGTYNETVTTKTAGTPDKKIIIRSQVRRKARSAKFILNHEHVRVEGFELSSSGKGEAVRINAGHAEVVDNYIHAMTIGINTAHDQPYAADLYIADNRIYMCQTGIQVAARKALVENNEIERMYKPNKGGDSDYCRFFGEDIVFKGNHFHGTNMDEVSDAHLDCWQTFDNNGEYVKNILFDGNTCTDCQQGLMGAARVHHKSSHLTFQNNIFARASTGLAIRDIPHVYCYHNVFYDMSNAAATFNGTYSKSNVVKNNILYKTNYAYTTRDIAFGGPEGEMRGDYNMLFWSQAPSSPGENNLFARPLFVDPAKGDFRLKEASPAINAGTDLGITHDFANKARPYNGAPDMGPFEYGAPDAGIKDKRVNLFPVNFPFKSAGKHRFDREEGTVFSIDGKGLAFGNIRYSGVYLVAGKGKLLLLR